MPPAQPKLTEAELQALKDKQDAEELEEARVKALSGGGDNVDNHLTKRELQMRLMNDSAMIRQMRDELFERSREMKDMFRRMDM